ncbi:MAG: amino acid adenylation domain-containing protein [Pseudomonadota bacterium]
MSNFFEATSDVQVRHLINKDAVIDIASRQKWNDLQKIEQQSLMLAKWNDTAIEYPLAQCIHQLFEHQVSIAPNAPALVFEEVIMTYDELNAAANKLARHLRSIGVGPDQRVALCVDRGFAMVIGILSIIKAGGAYVPLDPAYPQERLTYQVSDSAPKVLLVDKRGKIALAGQKLSVAVVDVDDDKPWASNPSANIPPDELGLTPNHLAYVIYTSGSTGQPKGVMNEHSGLVNRLLWMQDTFKLDKNDCVLQKTPFSFDVSVWEFFWPLLAGAKLAIARPNGHKSPEYLADLIEQEGITTLHFVPSMLQVYLAATGRVHKSLRQVFCSGEVLLPSARDDFFAHFPLVKLHNLYGPTEAAVDVTWYPCKNGQYLDKVPIGRPIANTRIYLLDSQGESTPVGEIGEIYIAGVQVARGYLNRPELTAERFLPDIYASDQYGRMYRTGDLGRWLADGNIEYLGRNDFQVKLHGLRIELGEIEMQLVQHPDIILAAVKKIEHAGEAILAAWYMSKNNVHISAAELRSFLKQMLPQYMIPSLFIETSVMPLNNSGKIDRNKLAI